MSQLIVESLYGRAGKIYNECSLKVATLESNAVQEISGDASVEFVYASDLLSDLTSWYQQLELLKDTQIIDKIDEESDSIEEAKLLLTQIQNISSRLL